MKTGFGLYVDHKNEIGFIHMKLQRLESQPVMRQYWSTEVNMGLFDAKVLVLRNHYTASLMKLNQENRRIEEIIDNIEDEQQRILMKYRYIDGMKWEDICEKMYCSWGTVHRIHMKILNSMKDDGNNMA